MNEISINNGQPYASDVEAITMWLTARGTGSENTFRAYKHEAERFLNWLAVHRLNLKDVAAEDIQSYLMYLEQPSKFPLLTDQQTSPSAQPLQGLSESSIAYARTILNQLFNYLVDLDHVRKNVVRLTKKPTIPVSEEVTRYLDLSAWEWLWEWVVQLPAATAADITVNRRTRWILALLYHTGLRREEVAKGSMSDFLYQNDHWRLKVIGKRKKIRYVTVNSLLLNELKLYRQHLGLDELPSSNESFGLIVPLRGNKNRRMDPRSIGRIIFDIREAAILECEDDHIKVQIINMSTHWMRHTNATHRSLAGASLETTKDELGHADPKTTHIYMKTADTKRQEDSEKLAGLIIKKRK